MTRTELLERLKAIRVQGGQARDCGRDRGRFCQSRVATVKAPGRLARVALLVPLLRTGGSAVQLGRQTVVFQSFMSEISAISIAFTRWYIGVT